VGVGGVGLSRRRHSTYDFKRAGVDFRCF